MQQVISFVKSPEARQALKLKFSQVEGLNYIETTKLDLLLSLIHIGSLPNLILVDAEYDELSKYKDITLVWDHLKITTDQLKRHIDDVLEINIDDSYTAMPIHLFHHFSTLPVDVFIKMQKESKSHFVRRFLAKDTIQSDEIESFIKRGIKELWVEKDSIKFFSKELVSSIKKDINTQSLAITDIEVNERVFASLGEMIKKVGVKPAVVDLCDSWMNSLAKNSITCMHAPVKEWYERLTQDPKLDFHFKLVRLTTLLCGQYVLNTDWVSKDEQAARLAGVALFADMSLTEPRFIHYRSHDMLQELKGEDRLSVATHAMRSAQIISNANFITKDISILVTQHHGCPDGERIPPKISSHVSALAHIYILSEDMAYHLIKDANISIADVYQGIKSKYQSTPLMNYLGNFPKFLNIS